MREMRLGAKVAKGVGDKDKTASDRARQDKQGHGRMTMMQCKGAYSGPHKMATGIRICGCK